MNVKPQKDATLGIALIPILFLILFLIASLTPFETKLGLPDISVAVQIPLFISALFAALIATTQLGQKWSDLEEGITETIKMSMGAILILMTIGMVVGTWIVSGIVPAMIFYGLQILTPGMFLAATLIICSIVSLATGSSWTTAGTVGIALMGIGQGLGIPASMVGGAIISGAYFGDKMSPLSDTTNLAPAMAGATLFDHIRHMVFTTGPSYVISLILFSIIGIRFSGNQMDGAAILELSNGLSAVYSLNPLLLLAPVLVIAMVILRIPALPGLFGGAVLGGIFAMVFQNTSFNDVLNVLYSGYVSTTGVESIDTLLSRGGMTSMMSTVSLILCAMMFGGVMERSGMLGAIAASILKLAKSTGSLVTATILSCIFINIIAGDQYLAIVIPGRMYKTAFDERGLAPKNLSRCLEDSGTLTSPLVPWNTCGATMISTLGLAPFAYVPYCFLNLINPVVSIIYGYTGFTMDKLDPKDSVQGATVA